MKLCKIQATTSSGSVATILEHVKDEETLKQDIAILKDKNTWVRKAKKKKPLKRLFLFTKKLKRRNPIWKKKKM